MKVTVLGATGFIGSHLVAALRRRNCQVYAPSRDESLRNADFGLVYYCIGLTAAFRDHPRETVNAHVCRLNELLMSSNFTRLVYLSSTRLYSEIAGPTVEDTPLRFVPENPDDLYNISKAMGESLVLNCRRPARVARVANVYGPDWKSMNFLPTLIKQSLREGRIVLQTSLSSAKDYVHLDDVIDLLLHIGLDGAQPIYNVASGQNVTNKDLLGQLAAITGCQVQIMPDSPTRLYPEISIRRAQAEFDYSPRPLPTKLPEVVECYQQNKTKWM